MNRYRGVESSNKEKIENTQKQKNSQGKHTRVSLFETNLIRLQSHLQPKQYSGIQASMF